MRERREPPGLRALLALPERLGSVARQAVGPLEQVRTSGMWAHVAMLHPQMWERPE